MQMAEIGIDGLPFASRIEARMQIQGSRAPLAKAGATRQASVFRVRVSTSDGFEKRDEVGLYVSCTANEQVRE